MADIYFPLKNSGEITWETVTRPLMRRAGHFKAALFFAKNILKTGGADLSDDLPAG